MRASFKVVLFSHHSLFYFVVLGPTGLLLQAFGDTGCIDFVKTDIDREVDDASLFPRSFTFEKMLAGKHSAFELISFVILVLSRSVRKFNFQSCSTKLSD